MFDPSELLYGTNNELKEILYLTFNEYIFNSHTFIYSIYCGDRAYPSSSIVSEFCYKEKKPTNPVIYLFRIS